MLLEGRNLKCLAKHYFKKIYIMKPEENKRAVMVGLFILFSIILFVIGILTLGGKQSRFTRTIQLKTVFNDVGGLKKGNNIWFSGVKVGTVSEISFSGKSQVEVTMRIEKHAQKYIKKNSHIRISTDGFIGNKILIIEGGSPDAPQVESGDLLEAVVPLNTDDIMATLQENNKNLEEITRDFKAISAQLVQGQGTVGALLNDSAMAFNLKAVMANLEQVSANTVAASGALNQFTTTLNTEDGLANQLLTDTLVFQQLKTSVAQLQQTATSMSMLTENLNQTSKKLNDTNNSVGVLLNDEQFGAQLKNTMGNLESSTEKLDENMEALQHNFLFRRYFKRKAKEEQKLSNSNEN
jgi:phospholipid/cholesterol/gamma-HCH transport system substrate-binding protein